MKNNPSQIYQYRVVHGAVWLVLEGFFALHLQGWISPIPNRTSPVEEWELVYKRCCAPYQFDAVSFIKKNKNQITLKSSNNSNHKKQKQKKHIHNDSLKTHTNISNNSQSL